MKFNKWLLVLASAFTLAAFTEGYCETQTAEVMAKKEVVEKTGNQNEAKFKGKVLVTDFSRVSEENAKVMAKKYFSCDVEKVLYVESISDCLAMIKSGRADFMFTSDILANYMIQRNPELKSNVLDKNLCIVMGLRNSDVKLRDSINSAITKIKESGKYDQLYKTWIKDLPVDSEPSLTTMEKNADSETVYVGVTGAMPPLDYIAADGKPAGFSIAFLSEVAKMIGKNIEVVVVESQARYAALEAEKIDVFFWMFMPENKAAHARFSAENAEEAAFMKKFITTEPYCVFKPAFLLKK
ncbi:MAG TPA: transporter substrate-binding domain-containing protein [Candidatus Wallbacteria bacterium]|nr:MAG: cystine transporter subunit [bacterium ADurb.Bin243]HOD39063.1 transporter substrate-binding domain-containing protein [Candidatus Wallbacteria bacterium]HPG57516.1 transporter substrate-binding domain-containing protein [Candidatus Wallbacteria bacterium]